MKQILRFTFGFYMISIMMSCQKEKKTDYRTIFETYYGAEKEQPGGSLFLAQAGKPLVTYNFGEADLKKETPNSAHLKYRMASVSKHFTAYAVYQLIDQGKVELNTRLTTILKGMNVAYNKITIGELLNHTSGIRDYEDLIPDDQEEQLSDADVFALVKDEDTTYFKPGSEFRYSNTGFCLLTLVVEELTDLPYATYMRQQVFEPNHLAAQIYEADTPPKNRAYGYHPVGDGQFQFADQSLTSATKGDGGVYITPEEFSKWAQRLMGELKEKDSYASVLDANKFPVTKNVDYSMGWFLLKDLQDNRILAHSGETTGFHNIVVLDPALEESATLFTNRDDTLIGPAFDEVLKDSEIDLPAHKPSLFAFLSGVYAHQTEK